MSNERKKEKHRLKRKQKQQQARKAKSASPLKYLADERQPITAYINDNWQQQGMANLLVLKQLRGGTYALGAFLLDTWCLGLKGVFGRLEITAQEFRDTLTRQAEQFGVHPVPLDVDSARRLVAGGIRMAQEHGFRLPHHYERWVAMLGIEGPQPDADLSDYGVDGDPNKLRYVGSLDDLRKRLIRESLEDFMQQPNVEIVSMLPEDALLENVESEEEGEESLDAEELDQMMASLREKLANEVRKWCFANGQVPHPRIPDAVDLMYSALMQIPGDPSGQEKSDEALAREGEHLLEHALELSGNKSEQELRVAMEQVSGFMQSFKSPAELFTKLGLEDDSEDSPFP